MEMILSILFALLGGLVGFKVGTYFVEWLERKKKL